MKISVLVEVEFEDGEHVMTREAAQLVHEQLVPLIREGETEIRFVNAKILTSDILSIIFGQMLLHHSREYLRENVTITGIPLAAKGIMKQVIENAANYYAAQEVTEE